MRSPTAASFAYGLLLLLKLFACGLLGLFPFALNLGEVVAQREMSCDEISELRRKIAIQLLGSAGAAKRCG
jgi:hypothetical protein